jgi:hypothetical protein
MVVSVFRRENAATLGAVVVIIWGIAVLLSVLVGSAVVLAMLATEPNWSEITLALATVVLALATVGLTVAAFFALGSIREARLARNLAMYLELSKRRDSDEFLDVRRRVRELAAVAPDGTPHVSPGPDGLKSSIETLRDTNDPEYRKLLRQPNFLQDVAILIKLQFVDLDIVLNSFGHTIPYQWSLWKPTIDEMRQTAKVPAIYEEFEHLAKRIAAGSPLLSEVHKQGAAKAPQQQGA